jgi:hypothetical protein
MFLARKPGLKYISRGDPVAYDYTQATITIDSGWHTMDLSAIIPANAKLVKLRAVISKTDVSQELRLREAGLTNDVVAEHLWSIAGFVIVDKTFDIPCVGQQVEYYATAGVWNTIGIVVVGWWL